MHWRGAWGYGQSCVVQFLDPCAVLAQIQMRQNPKPCSSVGARRGKGMGNYESRTPDLSLGLARHLVPHPGPLPVSPTLQLGALFHSTGCWGQYFVHSPKHDASATWVRPWLGPFPRSSVTTWKGLIEGDHFWCCGAAGVHNPPFRAMSLILLCPSNHKEPQSPPLALFSIRILSPSPAPVTHPTSYQLTFPSFAPAPSSQAGCPPGKRNSLLSWLSGNPA